MLALAKDHAKTKDDRAITEYPGPMTYTTADGRRQVLDALARAIEEIGVALAALGEAYELLDERTADRLEQELFRPVQMAYGRAQRTYAGFAGRHELPSHTFAPRPRGLRQPA